MTLPGRRASGSDSGPRTTHCKDLQEEQEEEDSKVVLPRRRAISRTLSQTPEGRFQGLSPIEE